MTFGPAGPPEGAITVRRYLIAPAVLMTSFLVLFLVAEAMRIPILTDPTPWLLRGDWSAAALGIGLLTVDLALPVPASIVMVALGARFGVFLGTLLSLAGGTTAALLGFALGRRGGPLLTRLVSADERARADELLAGWGAVAIVITRPVPILAESVMILAGASPMRWSTALIAAVAGLLPSALLYAVAGAAAATFENTVLVFVLALAMGGLFWWAGRRWRRGRPREN